MRTKIKNTEDKIIISIALRQWEILKKMKGRGETFINVLDKVLKPYVLEIDSPVGEKEELEIKNFIESLEERNNG